MSPILVQYRYTDYIRRTLQMYDELSDVVRGEAEDDITQTSTYICNVRRIQSV